MPRKLLVADDSVTIQKVVQLAFAEEEIEIETAGNGDQAIERIRNNRPDVLLADIFMPGRSGYELCEMIKSDPDLSSIRVVLLVGTFEPFDEAEAARVGCDSYLTKPFDTSELLDVVHSLIDRSGQKAAAQRTPPPQAAPQPIAPPPQPLPPPSPRWEVPVQETPQPALEELRDAAVMALGGPVAAKPFAPPTAPSDEALEALADENALAAALSPRGSEESAPVSDHRQQPAPAESLESSPTTAERRDVPLSWSTPLSGLISDRTRKSFLGGDSILDLFGGSELPPSGSGADTTAAGKGAEQAGAAAPVAEPELDALVDKVARRLSADVVREVALAVVPKIAEEAVERYLRDRGYGPRA